MSLTQKAPTTNLTLGDHTIRVPNQVVARAPSHAINTLEESQIFVSVGSNGSLDTSPPIVHFGGFRTENIHELTVRVINKSDKKQRIHVLPPQTASFKFDVTSNGFIRPGLSQEIKITFRPSEYRYYYDCIRLHCPGQNILVPIHAYPVVAKINCPSTLDFGMVPIGQELEKVLSFSCDVPIQFEYKLACLEANNDFTITPMLGIIPAEGSVQVHVLFRPTRLYTSMQKISVSLSQFGFNPFTVQLRGNTLPPDPMPKPPSVEDPSYMGPRVDKIMTAVHDAAREKMAQKQQGTGSPGGETSAGVEGSPEKRKKKLNPATMTLLGGKEEEVDGLYLPEELDNWANSMYVLTQTKGKLKLDAPQSPDKGISEGSSSHSDPKAITRAAVAAVNAATESKFEDVEVAWGGRPLPRQLAEFKYKQEMDIRVEYDKAKAVKWLMAPGLIEISAEDIAAAHQERGAREIARKAQERAACRASFDTGPSAVKVASVVGATLDITPTFDVYLNDAWRVRKEVLGNFVSHVRAIVIRQRLERRIALLNPKGDASSSSTSATEAAATSAAAAAAASKSSSRLTSEKIVQKALPIYREENFADRTPVNAEYLQDFRDWPILPIKVQPTYKLLGYAPQKPVPVPSHLPLEKNRTLRVGGEDEYPVRGPRGNAAVAAASIPSSLPPAMQLQPATPTPAAIPYLHPNDSSVMYATGIAEVETALEFVLRPYDRSAVSSSSSSGGGSSSSTFTAAASLLGLKTPSSFFLPRKSEIACISDPLPPLMTCPLPVDLSQLVPVPPQDDDDRAAAAGAGSSPSAPPVTPAPPSVEAINAFSIPPLDISQDETGLVQRQPWVSALRQTEQALQQERTRLALILPRCIEEYNASVNSEYLRVLL